MLFNCSAFLHIRLVGRSSKGWRHSCSVPIAQSIRGYVFDSIVIKRHQNYTFLAKTLIKWMFRTKIFVRINKYYNFYFLVVSRISDLATLPATLNRAKPYLGFSHLILTYFNLDFSVFTFLLSHSLSSTYFCCTQLSFSQCSPGITQPKLSLTLHDFVTHTLALA